jgi:hypothetical protein
MRMRIALLAVGLLLASAGFAAAGGKKDCPTAGGGEGPKLKGWARQHDCLRLNQIQVLGTHNSYHIEPMEPLFTVLLGRLAFWEYTHVPLAEQFQDQGVRQIELDVFADPQGGLFREPLGNECLGLSPPDAPELDDPGFKVLHVQGLDFESTCRTFVGCLDTIKAWSDQNPRHLPIAVLVELKDDALPIPAPVICPALEFVVPVPIDGPLLDALDQEVRSVFSPERLITPDDVRGERDTLEQAVLLDGWPTLGASRGRVMFLMDNGGHERTLYLEGHPNLEDRVLFTNSVPGDPDAAFVKLNNPLGDPTLIPDVVAAGYLVRTRADADTFNARSGDTTQRDAALASGAHFVSTDYPVPDPDFPSDYSVTIPGGAPARCNPVTAPKRCKSARLEDL